MENIFMSGSLYGAASVLVQSDKRRSTRPFRLGHLSATKLRESPFRYAYLFRYLSLGHPGVFDLGD